MERELCSARDILNDIWGPLSPRKRKSGEFSPIKHKSPRHGDLPNLGRSILSPSKMGRNPLSPSKFNIDNNTMVDKAAVRKVSRSLFDTDIKPQKSIKNKAMKLDTPKKARPSRDELFGSIKAALSLECPDIVLGRETECENIKKFIKMALDSKVGKGLYISGQPGTGKSATINNILKSIEYKNTGKLSHTNATNLDYLQVFININHLF